MSAPPQASSHSRRESVGNGSPQPKRQNISSKALEKPKPPRELFADDLVAKEAGEGLTSSTDLSEDRIEREWTQLGKEGQQYWEAQFGRQMLEFQQLDEVQQRQTPSVKFGYNAVEGMKYDFEQLNFDADALLVVWQEFWSKALASIFGVELEDKKAEDVTEDKERASSRAESEPPGSEVLDTRARILYRGELYKLRQRMSRERGRRTLGATLKKTFESHLPLSLKLETKQDLSPIFEITQFLAAPPEKPKRRDLLHRDPGSESEEEARIPADPPETGITARLEVGTLITINSSSIIEAIHAVAPEYPELVFDGDSLVVPEPFCLLLQYRDQMLAHRKTLTESSPSEPRISREQPDQTPEEETTDEFSASANHITELYNFLDHKYMDAVSAERQRWKQSPAVCTFEWLWLLFSPQTLVYRRRNAKDPIAKAYMVKHFRLHGLFNYENNTRRPIIKPRRLDTRKGLKLKHRLEKITITLTYLEHDGRTWQQRHKLCTIRPFNGERAITELPVFPTSFLDDPNGDVRSKLVARGQRYHSLASRGQVEYHGLALSGTRRTVHGRIIVDSETFSYDEELAYGDSPFFGFGFRERRGGYSSEDSRYAGRRPQEEVVYVSRGRGRPPRDRQSPDNYDTGSEYQSDSDVGSQGSLDWDTKFRNVIPGKDKSKDRTGSFATQLDLNSLKLKSLPSDKALSDDLYMVCTGKLCAYVMKEQQWVLLDVDSFTECSYDEHMIDDLQISDETKRLLRALSQNYMMKPKQHSDSINKSMTAGVPGDRKQSPWQPPQANNQGRNEHTLNRTASFPARWSADFIPNKGQGQIILLHGKPGVGKTSSAECLAELTKRPLLTVTCGNLGTDVRGVDKELSRWLRLGDLWNAILLFDEADVFLESREKGDLERNTLVSIFLRALEYYQGLIFLTTNRIGVFDEAILSRIHVVLHFPDLSHTDRERIWDTSFRKLDAERSDFAVDLSLRDYVYRDEAFKALNWNGREIRNAFNTMVALAEWDARENNRFNRQGKVEIRKDHLQQVAKMSSSFKEYLKSLRGIDEAKYAKFKMVRNDVFVEKT